MDKVKEFLLKVGENIYKAWEMGWYPFFLFFFLLSITTYGQSSERTQKQAKVMEQRAKSTPPYNPNNNNNQNWRPRPQRVYHPYYYNPNIYGYTPYWNTNRRWDNRTYIVTTDENRTKSQQPPMRFSVGVLSEVTTQQPNTFSPYLTIGRESFLLLQYHLSNRSPYPYYDNIYSWEVEEWEDEYMGTAIERNELVIGFGKSIKRFSPFIGLGIGRTTQWETYRDETFILSPRRLDGYYRINEMNQTNFSAKVGFTYGWEWMEGITQISLGKELRIGLGIGIKL